MALPSWKVAETQGFEPWVHFNAYNALARRRLKPLGHVSSGPPLTRAAPPEQAPP